MPNKKTPEQEAPKQRNQWTAPTAPLVAIPPARPISEDVFVSIPEIADIANPPVKYTTVEQWKARRRVRDVPFLEPDDHVGSFPIWRLDRVKAWFEATGRPYKLDDWKAKRAAGGYRRRPTGVAQSREGHPKA